MSKKNNVTQKTDPFQADVVNDRNKGNLLVSASAGAGKTKVLVNRVIKELEPKVDVLSNSGAEPKLGIDNFLIVTFTRAAAEEMKQRIQKELQNNINQNRSQPYREALLQQIGDLPTANIGTLDSFCQKVVDHYYYVIGMDPHFRILNDSTEVILLRDLVWKDIREKLYHRGDKNFNQLVINFFKRHFNADNQLTDPLTALVYALYNSYKLYVYVDDKKGHGDHKTHEGRDRVMKINSDPDKLFDAWSKAVSRMYNVKGSLKQSSLYKDVLSKQMSVDLGQIIDRYQHAEKIAEQNGLDLEYQTVARECQAIKNVRKLISPKNDCSWDYLRQKALNVVQICKHRFPSKKKSKDKTLHTVIQKERNAAKKSYYYASLPKSFINKFFIMDEAHNKTAIGQSYRTVRELLHVVKLFNAEYTKVKRQRHVLEFIDVERSALAILEKSRNVRSHFQKQFHEIMIDEYQDDNQLQDAIIKLIARHNVKTGDTTNVFMVGDVKQSIYRFRSADPKLFLRKFKDYRRPNANDNQVKTLKRNYRSTRNIDRFVNLVFSQIMGKKLGGVDYSTETERFGAEKYVKPSNHVTDSLKRPVNIMIYDQFNQDTNAKLFHDQEHRPTQLQDTVRDSTYGQIEMVAQAIRRLVNDPDQQILAQRPDRSYVKRPIQYRDIALIASTRDDNVAISDVFRRYHIPVQMLGSQNYFKTTEIQIMLSLLELIDNPDQDIPLVAVLRSPMVGLDENQLAYLRITNKTDRYYQAVKDFYNNYQTSGYPKSDYGDRIHKSLTRFLSDLKKFRKITQRHGLVDLIWSIYQTTGFLDYVGGMPAGVQRQANLHALYERAAQYEQANFHGLFQFVRFIHQLQNQNKDLTDAVPQQGKDMVTSVTIHNSKGREFPVVFLIDAARGFNHTDLHQDYILSNDLGLGLKYFNPKLHSESNTLPYQCLNAYEGQKDKSEEMRKLYVALTRTEQRLYVVGQITINKRKGQKVNHPRTKLFHHWEKLAVGSHPLLSLTERLRVDNYLDWIGASLIRLPSFRKKYAKYIQGDLTYRGLKGDQTNVALTFATDKSIVKNRKRLSGNGPLKLVSRRLTPNDKQTIQKVMYLDYPDKALVHEGNYRSVSDVKQLFADPNNVEMGRLDQVHHRDHRGLSNQYVTGDFATPKFIQRGTKPKATEIGTATHLVLQMLDLSSRPTKQRIDDTIQKLLDDQMIDQDVARHISWSNIASFFNDNWLGQKILRHPDEYHRETPFSLLLNAHRFLPNEFKNPGSASILIHGIIDGYFYDKKNGEVDLVDYKTDYVDFHHKEASVKKIVGRYQGQLNLYGKALKSVYGRDSLKYKGLYLLSLHRLVPVK